MAAGPEAPSLRLPGAGAVRAARLGSEASELRPFGDPKTRKAGNKSVWDQFVVQFVAGLPHQSESDDQGSYWATVKILFFRIKPTKSRHEQILDPLGGNAAGLASRFRRTALLQKMLNFRQVESSMW